MTRVHLRLTGVAALWGGTFIAGRIAAPVLPHFTLAALRFWTGFAILALVLLLTERRWPKLRPRDLALSALLALTGLVIYNLTTHKLNVRVAAAWEAVTST